MKIRKAGKQDVDTCVRIGSDFFGQLLENDLARQIMDDQYLVLVAEINGKIVGFVTAHKHAWNNSCYIERFYVEQEHRSKGYGSKLLSEVANRARQSKLRIIFVDLPPQNARAMRFYLKNSFQKAGQIREMYDDPKNPDAMILSYKL